MKRSDKLKRAVVILLALLLIVCGFAGRSQRNRYKFVQPLDTVMQVDFVVYAEQDGFAPKSLESEYATEPEPKILKTLPMEKMNYFLTELVEIQGGRYTNDPPEIEEGDRGIMLTYSNGDYEIISTDATQFRHMGDKNLRVCGYWKKSEAMKELVKRYMDE